MTLQGPGKIENQEQRAYHKNSGSMFAKPRFSPLSHPTGTEHGFPLGALEKPLQPLRYLLLTDPENFVLYYFDSVRAGLAFEWSGTKSGSVYKSDRPDSIIVHRRGVAVIPNRDSQWISSGISIPFVEDQVAP